MIDPVQLRDLVIAPTLKAMGGPLNSEAAVQLLLATVIHESTVGGVTYLRQLPDGPAIGLLHMEPSTWHEVVAYLDRRPQLLPRVEKVAGPRTAWKVQRLVGDLYFATAFARIRYWWEPEPLPAVGDRDGITRYWSRYYQTSNDPAKEALFAAAWDRHMPTEAIA